jgi:type VI secretion system protein ImpA
MSIDFVSLAGAVSDEEPCGPDLDLAGDAEYMNFIARTEGLLPATFFSGPEGKPFDRSTIDFNAEFALIGPLLERTRDLRLLALLAKLLVLNRDLAGFAACVGLIEALLKQRWDQVHPQATDGDFAIRMAALESLDDMPPVVFPLQYAPLTNHRRLGPLSYRSWMIATGEAKPREGETVLDPAAIESALLEAELPELVEMRGRFQSLQASLHDIRDICVGRIGGERSAKLEKLPGLTDKILALLDGIVVKRDPSLAVTDPFAAEVQSESPSTIPVGAVASPRDVADALAAIGDYFTRFEPSNPALLLVRQAEQLIGKSFLEAMRILVPDHLDKAAIQIGKDQQMFDLPLARLSEFAESVPAADESAPEENGEGPRRRLEAKIEARTRDDAIRLLEQVASFYRIAEPSSPVPFLTERARSFAQRDFLSLLRELLPEGALKSAN